MVVEAPEPMLPDEAAPRLAEVNLLIHPYPTSSIEKGTESEAVS